MPLTKTGENTYTSTFENRPFGGSNFQKGQFSITVVEKSHVNFILNVTDSYAEKDGSSFRRQYKISAVNISWDPDSPVGLDIDDFEIRSDGFMNRLAEFEFSEVETVLSSGKVYNKKLIAPYDYSFNSISLRILWDAGW